MIRTILTIAACAAPFAALGASIAYDRSETRTEYRADQSFLTGQPGVWKFEHGRLFEDTRGELVGYYGGGNPRVIGFGCDGADMPVIAMNAVDLPDCARVAPITQPRTLEVR